MASGVMTFRHFARRVAFFILRPARVIGMSLLADNPTWTIAERIKRARLLAGLDQDDVAEACHVARPTVSAWETGKTEPKFSSLVRVARLTGKPLEWFADAVNAETAPAEAGAVSVLSQHSARPEGLEPPTFCFGGTAADLDDEWAFWSIVTPLTGAAL